MHDFKTIPNLSITGVIVIAWVFFTSVYFFLSVGYPLIVGKIQNAEITIARQEGYNTALSVGQQQGYNIAVEQAMKTFSGNVFQNGYGKAVLDLASALDAQVKGGCKEAVPVTIGSGSLGIINTACIAQAQSQTGAAQ